MKVVSNLAMKSENGAKPVVRRNERERLLAWAEKFREQVLQRYPDATCHLLTQLGKWRLGKNAQVFNLMYFNDMINMLDGHSYLRVGGYYIDLYPEGAGRTYLIRKFGDRHVVVIDARVKEAGFYKEGALVSEGDNPLPAKFLRRINAKSLINLPDSDKNPKGKNPAQMALAPGGIDLNPAQMSMQVKNEGQDFKFNFNGMSIDAAQVIGATFTIRTMTPVTNLPLLLGLTH